MSTTVMAVPNETSRRRRFAVILSRSETGAKARGSGRSLWGVLWRTGLNRLEKPMATDVTQRLEAAALALPREERARLAQRLIESLDDDPEAEEAWAVEIRRRLDAMDREEVEMIPADQVLAEARRRLGA